MSASAPRTVYLVSDGTCRTCEQVVRAVLVQFDSRDVRLVRKANVCRPETVVEVVRAAASEHALIFYTLVYDKARLAMATAARQYMVPAVDLLGPVLIAFYDLFKSVKRAKPGALYKSNKAHFDRIDAVEYTLHHDDGCAMHELGDADVVLVGVSRTSKSTTCFYLAYEGIRAANVPLLPNADAPPELLQIDQRRIIGLTVNPERLRTVRQTRLRGWGMNPYDTYADPAQIAHELRSANALMAKHGWQCIDVSYKAIEEIAAEVLRILRERGVKLRSFPGVS